MKKILTPFSYIAHPLFVPFYGLLLFLSADEGMLLPEQNVLLLLQIGIITIFLPLCCFFLLRAMGKADSMMLEQTAQRKVPLLLQMALFGMLLWRSVPAENLPELHYFLLSALWSTAIAFLLVFVDFKCSLHLMGMAGLIGFAIGLSILHQQHALFLLAGLLLLTGLVAASRLEMQAHDLKELAAGFVVGLLPQILLWHLWL